MWFLPEITDQMTGYFFLFAFLIGLLATAAFLFFLLGAGDTFRAWIKGEDWRAVWQSYMEQI